MLRSSPGCGGLAHPYTFSRPPPPSACATKRRTRAPRPRPWGCGRRGRGAAGLSGPLLAGRPQGRLPALLHVHSSTDPGQAFRCPRTYSPAAAALGARLRGKARPCCARPSWTWPSPAAQARARAPERRPRRVSPLRSWPTASSGQPPPAGGAGARDALFESPPGGGGGDCSAGSHAPADQAR